jgi:type I restriction enzyme S subunit
VNLASESIDKIVSGSRWATTIGAICDSHGGDIQTGPFGSQLHASDYADEGTPVVMPRDMQNGTIVCDRIARIPQNHAERLRQHVLLDGDVIYSRRGDVTRFAVVTIREQGWLCGTGSIRIRLNCADLEIGYVRQYLRQNAVGDWLQHNAKGVTMANLNTSIVRALPFVYPPLPYQRRIAEVLDRAEALRTKRRAALAQLDTLTQSIFLDLFGDPARNPYQFPEVEMRSLFSMPPIFGTMIPGSVQGGGWLVLRVANIQNWKLDLSDEKFVTLPVGALERHAVKDGDLLMARAIASEEHLGKAVIAYPGARKWAFDSHLMRLRFRSDAALPEFIRHFLMTPGGRQKFLSASRRTAVQFNINTKEMAALRLPLPPIERQRAFVAQVVAVDALRSTMRASLAELDALFSSLQHRAFRGEL